MNGRFSLLGFSMPRSLPRNPTHVSKFKGSHRHTRAELHGNVHVRVRRVPALDESDRFKNVRNKKAVDDESTRLIGDRV